MIVNKFPVQEVSPLVSVRYSSVYYLSSPRLFALRWIRPPPLSSFEHKTRKYYSLVSYGCLLYLSDFSRTTCFCFYLVALVALAAVEVNQIIFFHVTPLSLLHVYTTYRMLVELQHQCTRSSCFYCKGQSDKSQ